jgi:hypothetical protein
MSAGCVSTPSPQHLINFTTRVEYDLHIYSDNPIRNVTFLIPLPVRNGVPAVGAFPFTADNFRGAIYSVDIVRLSQEESRGAGLPQHSKTPWYLRIRADYMPSSSGNRQIFSNRFDNITLLQTPAEFKNTASPVGNESVFIPEPVLPALSLRQTLEKGFLVQYNDISKTRMIPVFAEYSTVPSNHVFINSMVVGSNSWGERDYQDGYNVYWDSWQWNHKGDSHGWQDAEGQIIAAVGTYPNPFNPVWQKAMNETASVPSM